MELKQSDLRVGNYILRDGKQIQVTAMTIFCLGKHHQPITLTEEWLLKFGFKKDGFLNSANRWMSIFNQPLIQGNGYFTIPNYPLTEIHYVHQLQNLYYDLTREELTIKQP